MFDVGMFGRGLILQAPRDGHTSLSMFNAYIGMFILDIMRIWEYLLFDVYCFSDGFGFMDTTLCQCLMFNVI